jgi:hypothetical protein
MLGVFTLLLLSHTKPTSRAMVGIEPGNDQEDTGADQVPHLLTLLLRGFFPRGSIAFCEKSYTRMFAEES